MADIEKDYTFAIPDEMFVDDFSGSKTHTFTYKGPDKLTVTLPDDNNGTSSAYTQSLSGPVYPGEKTVVIDLTVSANAKLCAIADLLNGREYDLVATFTDKTMPDDTIYKEHNNFTIHDIYWRPVANIDADGEFASWNLDSDGVPILKLLVRDALSPKMRTYLGKSDMFVQVLEQFTLSTAETTLLTNFKTALNTFRARVALPWKFIGDTPDDALAPPIPFDLLTRHQSIKAAGMTDLMKDDVDPALPT